MIFFNFISNCFYSRFNFLKTKNDPEELGNLKTIPLVCIGEILKNLTITDLLNFSLCNRNFLRLVKDDIILKIFISHIHLNTIPSQSAEDTFKFGYIIYNQLRLKERLGERICNILERMKIYPKKVPSSFNKANISNFEEKSNKKNFYKTLIEGNLTLIFLTENVYNSTLFYFNRKFNEKSLEKRAFFCSVKKIGHSAEYYVDSQSSSKEENLKNEWDHIKQTIENLCK